jgi:hypothetical protein
MLIARNSSILKGMVRDSRRNRRSCVKSGIQTVQEEQRSPRGRPNGGGGGGGGISGGPGGPGGFAVVDNSRGARIVPTADRSTSLCRTEVPGGGTLDKMG